MDDPDSTSFRDNLATADKRGKRIWIFPIKPKGKLYTFRTVVSWVLLAFFFGAPFVKVGGHQLLLFNVVSRKFVLFGLVFWPQDLYLFVLAAITFVVFIILFTAVFGRLFCGWICPQTIFMEMVFRKIEYVIEGNAGSQRRLANSPWTTEKLVKKGSKHVIFFGLSFLIGNLFLAYIIGSQELWTIVTAPPSQHLVGLTFMFLFSLAFYGVFSWFREQACTLVCPYGRLQSVLLDSNSIVVAYDYNRGEKRAPAERHEDFSKRGHCIDCFACVHVCPTGIDIRNGTQLECVNCTACIDSCNNVMRKLHLPPGLIRYSSANILEKGQRFRLTPRIVGYSVALLVLLTVMSVLLLNRTDLDITILRTPGMMYQETEEDYIRNLYNVKIVNKTSSERAVRLSLKPEIGRITMVGPDLIVPPDGLAESVFFVDIEEERIFTPNTLITIVVTSGEDTIKEMRTSFMGPTKGRKHERDED